MNVVEILEFYFPWRFAPGSDFFESAEGKLIVDRLQRIPDEPLTLTHLNQLLHLNSEAGVTEGAFRYYFLTDAQNHPYSLQSLSVPKPSPMPDREITTIGQLEWGIERFYTDALLYYGNLRSAYRHLRDKSFDELTNMYKNKRIDSRGMRLRGQIMPLIDVQVDDRYLISELACKAYGEVSGAATTPIIEQLVAAYNRRGGTTTSIKTLVESANAENEDDFQAQLAFPLATEEIENEQVESEEELRAKLGGVLERFRSARQRALENTKIYLSICNELDVYVATSMRNRTDFRTAAESIRRIFSDPRLDAYQLRYFDPTLSAANTHEDEGLIECLMVKRAKVIVYFAQERDSWGKDSEASMALSQGKPVIIYCPPTPEGRQRMKMFRDEPVSEVSCQDFGWRQSYG